MGGTAPARREERRVPTTQEVVATTPRIPGLEVRVPPGVVLQTADGPLTTITLTRILVDRPPFPLPEGAQFSFTPQTHSAVVQRADGGPSPVGVRFIMPNVEHLPPGTRIDLWTYDAQKRWYSYGKGTVSPDGQQIVPDAGVEFHQVTCYFLLGANPAATASILGGARDGDPVDLATGLFIYEKVDLVVDDVIPIVMSRHYRQGDTSQGVRAFGLNTQIPYQMFLTGDGTTYSYAELNLADGARVRFDRISSGTGYTDAVMEHTATPSKWYKARLERTRRGNPSAPERPACRRTPATGYPRRDGAPRLSDGRPVVLSFELRNRRSSTAPDELEVFLDREGLDSLLAQLRLLEDARTDHVHLMSSAWGGTHLNDGPHTATNTPIQSVKIYLR